MKRRLALLLIALLLTGCERAPPPRLLGYEELGELRVATRRDSLSYRIADDGEETGFEHDLLLELGRYLGVPVKFSIMPGSLDSIMSVTRNNAHLAAAGLVRNDRQQVIWSMPIREVEYVLVGRNTPRRMAGEAELANRRIGVRRGSVPAEALEEIRKRVPSIKLTYPIGGGEAELLERVARGEIDLAASDKVNFNLASNFHPELAIVMPLKIKAEIAWAMPKGADPRFVDEVNAFIARIRKNGLLARLADRHFGHVERLDEDDVTALLQRIQTRLPRYKKYFMEAEQITGVDWRLIASIAYQESQWDPLATSYTGVRGMMMLTAETADRLRISNRLDARESIKGGARYFAMLRDQLAPEVGEPDRTWMAVAAYNLGMGHMNGARAIARRLGKDNTAWLPMKSVLPLMSRPAYAAQLKAGPARGGEAVIMTENVRNYFDILSRFEPGHRKSLGFANVDSEPGLKAQGTSTSSPPM